MHTYCACIIFKKKIQKISQKLMTYLLYKKLKLKKKILKMKRIQKQGIKFLNRRKDRYTV